MVRSGLLARLSLVASVGGAVACAGCGGCGRSQGNADQDLGGLVVAAKTEDQKIDLARVTSDPAELGRALTRPYRVVIAALGPHTVSAATTNTVDDGATRVSDLSDQTTLELGDAGAFHATYTNSADYGREAIFVGGQLYLRPRYQRWHQRAPETPDEPTQLRDAYLEGVGAAWDLLAPGVELSEAGPATIAGRAGKKIIVKLAPTVRKLPPEPLAQRTWRETRTIDAVSGEIVVDADSGLPLAVKLAGTITFQRDGRRFTMKLGASSQVDGVGKAVAVVAPGGDDVVATPERRRKSMIAIFCCRTSRRR